MIQKLKILAGQRWGATRPEADRWLNGYHLPGLITCFIAPVFSSFLFFTYNFSFHFVCESWNL